MSPCLERMEFLSIILKYSWNNEYHFREVKKKIFSFSSNGLDSSCNRTVLRWRLWTRQFLQCQSNTHASSALDFKMFVIKVNAKKSQRFNLL